MGGTAAGTIRIGIGGWTYEPWRGAFYPDELPQKRELEYASRKLTSIEINGTFYGSQKPETFAKWRDETPDGFVFSLKAPRFVTNRNVLAGAGATIERFFAGGVMELKDKLGPINWQLAPTKKFEPADFEAFLKLLPKEVNGRALRHVVEVRHDSFRSPDFIALVRTRRRLNRRRIRLPANRGCHRPFRLRPHHGNAGDGRIGLYRCRARSLGRASASLGLGRGGGWARLRRTAKQGRPAP